MNLQFLQISSGTSWNKTKDISINLRYREISHIPILRSAEPAPTRFKCSRAGPNASLFESNAAPTRPLHLLVLFWYLFVPLVSGCIGVIIRIKHRERSERDARHFPAFPSPLTTSPGSSWPRSCQSDFTRTIFLTNKIHFFTALFAFSPGRVSFSPGGVSYSSVSTFTSLRQSSLISAIRAHRLVSAEFVSKT